MLIIEMFLDASDRCIIDHGANRPFATVGHMTCFLRTH